MTTGPTADASEAALYAALAEVLRRVFKRDIALHPALTGRDIEGWDSFKYVEIILTLEDRFAMQFAPEELDRVMTVGDLVQVLATRRQA